VAILYSLKCDELLVDGVGRNSICTYKHTHTQYIKYIKTTCSDVPTTNAEISITNVGPVYRPTQYTKECFKFLDFPLADFCTSENVINFMDRNNYRWAAIGWRNTLR